MRRAKEFTHEGGELFGCGDAELYVECLGPREAPVLLMLHGGIGSIEDFGPICSDLARDYRLVGVDSRGHGRSTLGEAALSYERLREDLEVSHRAVSHWMDILDRLYFSFRIPPWTSHAVRGLRKMAKAYLWDWSSVPGRIAR